MDYRIETKEAFDIFGIEMVASQVGEEGYLKPHELWERCQKSGEYRSIELYSPLTSINRSYTFILWVSDQFLYWKKISRIFFNYPAMIASFQQYLYLLKEYVR